MIYGLFLKLNIILIIALPFTAIDRMQKAQILPQIKDVQITQKGIFKYILIEAKQEGTQATRLFVRGNDKLEFHADNYDLFTTNLKKEGYSITLSKSNEALFTAKKNNKVYKFKCLGGGRIEHNHKGHKCFVYGYSKSFGRIDHKIAQGMISNALGYKLEEVTTSQEGY